MKFILVFAVLFISSLAQAAAGPTASQSAAINAFLQNAQVKQKVKDMNAVVKSQPKLIVVQAMGDGCENDEIFLVAEQIESPDYVATKSVSAMINVSTYDHTECQDGQGVTISVDKIAVVDLASLKTN